MLNNERLVETITRPSAAAASSILFMFNILNTCTESTNLSRGGVYGVCSSENHFQAIHLNTRICIIYNICTIKITGLIM